jgi:hypothetical protein
VKKHSFIIILLFSLLLIGCGGGGGEGSTPAPSVPSPTPNSAPVISLDVTSITLTENASVDVSLAITDADNDALVVDIDGGVVITNYSETNNLLTLTAPQVDSDSTFTVSITATDSNNTSTTAELEVIVLATSEAPILNWAQETEPDYQVLERTFVSLPFNLSDVDTDLTDLTFDLQFEKVGTTQNSVEFTYRVDLENSLLVVTAGNTTRTGDVIYDGTFSVSDSSNTVTQNLRFTVKTNEVDTSISFLSNIFVIQGETDVVTYSVIASRPDDFDITSIEYVDDNDAELDKISFVLDEPNQTISITAKQDSFVENGDNIIELAINYDGNGSFQYSQSFTVNIRETLSQNEIDLVPQIADFQQYLILASEYEEIGLYINRYLLLNEFINSNQYKDNNIKLKTFRELQNSDATDLLTHAQFKLTNTADFADDATYAAVIADFTNQKVDLSNQRISQLS